MSNQALGVDDPLVMDHEHCDVDDDNGLLLEPIPWQGTTTTTTRPGFASISSVSDINVRKTSTINDPLLLSDTAILLVDPWPLPGDDDGGDDDQSLEPRPIGDATTLQIVDHIDHATTCRMLQQRLDDAEKHLLLETFVIPQQNNAKAARHDAAWHAKYHELVQYYHQHGHCNVPSKYPANPSLSHWVKRQRMNWKAAQKKKGAHFLDRERRDLLDQLGFVWDIYEDAWNSKFQLLLDYQKANGGSTNVPLSVDSNNNKYAGLGVWVKSQRRQYQLLQRYGTAKSTLTPDRVQKLNAVAFDWMPRGVAMIRASSSLSSCPLVSSYSAGTHKKNTRVSS